MKRDLLVNSLINFLIPILFLYVVFVVIAYFEQGIYVALFSSILFLIILFIYEIRSQKRIISAPIFSKIAISLIIAIIAFYIFAAFISIMMI